MSRIEEIIEVLGQEVRTNPLMRNIVELVVAIGEQILESDTKQPPKSQSVVQTSFNVQSHPIAATKATPCEDLSGNSEETEQAGNEQSSLSAEDLERLLRHFGSGNAHQMYVEQSRRTDDHDERQQEDGSHMRQTLSSSAVIREEATDEPRYDVEIVVSRARLKAEVSRWCADRLRGQIPYESEMRYSHGAIQRARSYPQCYLWMLQYQGPASLLEYVADCYDAIADIAPLLSLVPCSFHRPRWAEDLLEIAARIQSALYHALREAGLDVRRYPDPDQDAVFVWLKWYTRTFQKFIPRHMRLEDPADYTQIQCIIEQLDEIQQSIPPAVPSAEEQPDSVPSSRVLGIEAKKHLRTLRYHVSHILRGSLDHEYHWRRIGEEIARLLGLGVPPSNVELRSILLPVVDDMPTDDVFLTQPVRLVIREIDRYLAQQEILEQLEDELFPSSREVCSVRTVLEGKTVVLIGGEKRSHRCQAIENAFGLRQLLWVATRPHESLDDIVPFVKRDDVALVLLAIRWSSHSYTALADVCKWYGKPFVRLPGGYNPNQIAAQILTQAATALGLKAPAAGLEPATL